MGTSALPKTKHSKFCNSALYTQELWGIFGFFFNPTTEIIWNWLGENQAQQCPLLALVLQLGYNEGHGYYSISITARALFLFHFFFLLCPCTHKTYTRLGKTQNKTKNTGFCGNPPQKMPFKVCFLQGVIGIERMTKITINNKQGPRTTDKLFSSIEDWLFLSKIKRQK